MRFLIDANLPRSLAGVLREAGHESVDVRDIGMRSAMDVVIAEHARANDMAIVTRDFHFADIRNYPPEQYAGIVVLDLPDDADLTTILRTVHAFVQRDDLLARLPRRLAILEAARVRFRPNE